MLLLALLTILLQDAPLYRADVNLVTVPCAVSDARGVPVRDLKPEDFRLYDNGAPQQVRSLWTDRAVPLILGTILDASGSQHTFVPQHETAVTQFQERMLRPADRAFVVRVDERVILQSESDGALRVLLPQGRTPLGEPCPTLRGRSLCGGTALWNAVYAAAHLKMQTFQGSKAMVILSDGNDTGSIRSLAEALAEVQRAGIVVYAIRYPDPLSGQTGAGLRQLSAETGGLVFDPPGDDYAGVLERIESDLRSSYVLGLQPSDRIAGRHELRVEVARPGVTLRCRTAYQQ